MGNRLPAYPGYLFDLDGTLVDTAPDLNAALNHALQRAGLSAVEEELTRHWVGHGARVLVEKALEHQQASHPAPDDIHAGFLEYYEQHIADLSKPYPDVQDALAELQARRAKLAVVTNKLQRFTAALLPRVGLAQYFDLVVCGDTTGVAKPAADPALHACTVLGVAPADTLFVGDSTTDVGCARAAGCPVVCVRGGYSQGVDADELGADRVIESFLDLV